MILRYLLSNLLAGISFVSFSHFLLTYQITPFAETCIKIGKVTFCISDNYLIKLLHLPAGWVSKFVALKL